MNKITIDWKDIKCGDNLLKVDENGNICVEKREEPRRCISNILDDMVDNRKEELKLIEEMKEFFKGVK